jgi:RNA polymerase-binding transcription factor DksA
LTGWRRSGKHARRRISGRGVRSVNVRRMPPGVFELEKNLALEKQLSANLAMVDHALEKYKAGTYGVCDKCSNQIEPARLEALPYANLCLSCKAKQKKDAKA